MSNKIYPIIYIYFNSKILCLFERVTEKAGGGGAEREFPAVDLPFSRL